MDLKASSAMAFGGYFSGQPAFAGKREQELLHTMPKKGCRGGQFFLWLPSSSEARHPQSFIEPSILKFEMESGRSCSVQQQPLSPELACLFLEDYLPQLVRTQSHHPVLGPFLMNHKKLDEVPDFWADYFSAVAELVDSASASEWRQASDPVEYSNSPATSAIACSCLHRCSWALLHKLG